MTILSAWQLHSDASHAVFLDKRWLDGLVYINGQSFRQLQTLVPPEECCKMISRTLLGALKYKPDYLVIVSDADTGAPLASGLSMDTAGRSPGLQGEQVEVNDCSSQFEITDCSSHFYFTDCSSQVSRTSGTMWY
jgi:hypothetical protein